MGADKSETATAAKAAAATKPEKEIEEASVEDIDEDELDDADLDESIDEMFDPMGQLTQLLVTEGGTPIVDVLQGISDALDKQNKILYKLVSVVESKTA